MHSVLFCEAGQDSSSYIISNARWALLDTEVSSGAMHFLLHQGSLLRARAASRVPLILIVITKLSYSACLYTFAEKSLTFARSLSLFQSISFFTLELECPAGTLTKIKSRLQDSPAFWRVFAFLFGNGSKDAYFLGVTRIKYGYQELSLGWTLFT